MSFQTLHTIREIPESVGDGTLNVATVRVGGRSNTYEGIDIRRFWVADDGSIRPGKGVTFRTIVEAEEAMEAIAEAITELKEREAAAAASAPKPTKRQPRKASR